MSTNLILEFLPHRRGRELLHHGEQQLPVTLIQIRRVAANLGQKAKLLVRELLSVELSPQGVVGEELCDRQIEGLRDL